MNRNVVIDQQTGHRIDPLTGIDIDQAIANQDEVSLTTVEIAQLEAMDQADSYVVKSLQLARRRLTRQIKKL